MSPNSSASYKFIKKRRNSSNLNVTQPLNSSNSIHSNTGSVQLSSSNGNINTASQNLSQANTHFRGTGVGGSTDGKDMSNSNMSNYTNDMLDDGNDRVATLMPLVQTLALNESNMAAAYGGGIANNNGNSVGESSDNGGKNYDCEYKLFTILFVAFGFLLLIYCRFRFHAIFVLSILFSSFICVVTYYNSYIDVTNRQRHGNFLFLKVNKITYHPNFLSKYVLSCG